MSTEVTPWQPASLLHDLGLMPDFREHSSCCWFDIVGAGRHLLPSTVVAGVHRRYPRTDFRADILATMTGLVHAPGSHAAILGKLGFTKLAANNPLDSQDPA